jgi:hypothetical protein
MLEHGLSNSIVVDALEKANHAITHVSLLVGQLIISGANGSNRNAVPPGDEKLGLATLEKGSALGVDDFGAFGE